MVFSTIFFLCVFLPVTITGYYIMPAAAKNCFLLIASLFFYAWGEPRAVFVMLLSIAVNYSCGLLMTRGKSAGYLKFILAVSVTLNVGILFIFKYLSFISENLEKLTGGAVSAVSIALPIGISFYTFQGLSYVIDVYTGARQSLPDESGIKAGYKEAEAIKNPFELALYISMFPQLIAGPIVRFSDVAGYLKKREHSFEKFSSGAQRFITGLAKKVILANNTGLLADRIFNGDYEIMSCPVAWLGTLAYTLQIYLDFSAYSDMAIGLGKIFGFDFPENFDRPYTSVSVSEFWRRWHMSLSGWFRDYVYIPLGGSKRGNVYFNLLTVFVLTGIWHGAGWGFLIWGLWHGLFVMIERVIMKHKKKNDEVKDDKDKKQGVNLCIKKTAGFVYTMLVVMVGWTLFRIVDPTLFFRYLSVMLGMKTGGYTAYGLRFYLSDQNIIYLLLSLLVCIPFRDMIKLKALNGAPAGIAGKVICLILLAVSFMYMINSTYNPFIYFRF